MNLIHTLSSASRCAVEVYHDAASGEWTVRIPGQPDATYHTDSRTDALRTAEAMLGDLEVQASLAARAAIPNAITGSAT